MWQTFENQQEYQIGITKPTQLSIKKFLQKKGKIALNHHRLCLIDEILMADEEVCGPTKLFIPSASRNHFIQGLISLTSLSS